MRNGWWLAILLSLAPATVQAEQVRMVSGARIHLSDIVTDAPQALAGLDFGVSPAPGASRLVSRSEVETRLRRLGKDPAGLSIPDSVRLVGKGHEIAPSEVAEQASAVIRAALPRGISLVAVEPSPRPVLVAEGAVLSSALIPQFPRRAGRSRVTVTVEFVGEGRVSARVPLSVTVDVSEDAARPDIAKGSSVRLVLTRGAVSISASGVMLSDANVGDTVRATIRATGRTVRVLITSSDSAKVVGP